MTVSFILSFISHSFCSKCSSACASFSLLMSISLAFRPLLIAAHVSACPCCSPFLSLFLFLSCSLRLTWMQALLCLSFFLSIRRLHASAHLSTETEAEAEGSQRKVTLRSDVRRLAHHQPSPQMSSILTHVGSGKSACGTVDMRGADEPASAGLTLNVRASTCASDSYSQSYTHRHSLFPLLSSLSLSLTCLAFLSLMAKAENEQQIILLVLPNV